MKKVVAVLTTMVIVLAPTTLAEASTRTTKNLCAGKRVTTSSEMYLPLSKVGRTRYYEVMVKHKVGPFVWWDYVATSYVKC